MIPFKKIVPSTAGELWSYLKKLHENRKHVKRTEVNLRNHHLEVTLDFRAEVTGSPNFYFPLRPGSGYVARRMLANLASQSNGGIPPRERDARELFALIDDRHSEIR